jgi:hypothetical protein
LFSDSTQRNTIGSSLQQGGVRREITFSSQLRLQPSAGPVAFLIATSVVKDITPGVNWPMCVPTKTGTLYIPIGILGSLGVLSSSIVIGWVAYVRFFFHRNNISSLSSFKGHPSWRC